MITSLAELLRDRPFLKVVTTNGCFDILHPGHVALIQHAQNVIQNIFDTQGIHDARHKAIVLVVLVNDDASVARLKPGRPINDILTRMLVVDSLKGVSRVVPFSEDTPCEILEQIRPEVHIKDSSYKNKPMPEKELVERYGGKISFAPNLRCNSTTDIVEKIRGMKP